MTKSNLKKKYAIDEESEDQNIENLKEIEEEEEEKTPKELIKERREKLKAKVLEILSKGKVSSKADLVQLLYDNDVSNHEFRYKILTNNLVPHYPQLGGVLKNLRFKRKLEFSIENGSHCYYIDKQKILKVKKGDFKFNWQDYQIPVGENEIYLVMKIPCPDLDPQHFLASCLPYANFEGFQLAPDKKYEKTKQFTIFEDKLTGFFKDGKLYLKCNTADEDVSKTLYTLVQIGREIIEELLKLSFRYSEVLKIMNQDNLMFLPIVPIFRARVKKSFYVTKFNNVFRNFYDFPQEFKSKDVYGKMAILSKEIHDEKFEIDKYDEFIKESIQYQTKSFISNAIIRDWIINPNKTLNYMEADEELENLITEYLQDIDTDRIVQERKEDSLQASEFIKEIISNIMLTLLSLSLLADNAILQWIIVGVLVAINVFYIYMRKKKKNETIF
ncbi:MAG: hypothetical protein GF364_06580 [Candidatus Lokiarchaeota archaeon]|nr:hypothetical protein [Candidatus Lokiarchaeota archaeon]